MTTRRTAAAGAAGLGLAGLAAVAGVRLAGRRIQYHTRPDIDPYLATRTDVTHRRITTADGAVIHVAELGTGRPLVLLHGVSLQWWVWNPLFHLLADRYRVIAWDMRGHGESTTGSGPVTMDVLAADLTTVLDSLDLHDAVVVGHSMGGMILAQALLDRAPTMARRATAAVFMATSAAPLLPGAVVHRLVGLGRRSGAVDALRALWRPSALATVMVRAGFGREPSALAVEQTRQMIAGLPPSVSLDCGEALAGFDVRGRLGEITLPSLVVVGDDDRITPLSHAERIAAGIPGAALHILAGVGHQVMQEAPGEVVELLVDFAAPPARRRWLR